MGTSMFISADQHWRIRNIFQLTTKFAWIFYLYLQVYNISNRIEVCSKLKIDVEWEIQKFQSETNNSEWNK